jgi:hypothetical protein
MSDYEDDSGPEDDAAASELVERRHYARRYQRRRSDDSNPLSRLAFAIERYRLLWFAGITVSGWLGARLIEPLNEVAVLAQQHVTINARLIKDDSDRVVMKDVLSILVRLQCLQLDYTDRAKLNLDCKDIPVSTLPIRVRP